MKILAVFLALTACVFAQDFYYFGQTSATYKSQTPYGNNIKVGKFADVGDTKIYYEIYGRGKPIVVLHGDVVGSAAEMGEFIDRLRKSREVIVVSTRGHGRSAIGIKRQATSKKRLI